MNKAPAFQLYAQDFLTGVMYLTNEEIGIYIKILCKQWTDGSVPKKRLGFLVGLDWENFSEELKNKFIETEESLVNTRLEQERDKKIKFLKNQSINGKKGGRPNKSENPKKPKPFLNQKPNESQKKPLEVEKEEEVEKEIDYDLIKEMFNNTCTELKNVLTINQIRKENINYLIKEYKPSDIESFFHIVFNKVRDSRFLNGGGSNGFIMTFDWMLKPENFLKIIENNYQDEKPNNKKTGKQYSDDFKRKIAQGLQS